MSLVEMLIVVVILLWLVGYTAVPIGGLLQLLVVLLVLRIIVRVAQAFGAK